MVGSFSASVSPLEVSEEDEGFGERGLPEGVKTEELERVGAEEEGDFIRKINPVQFRSVTDRFGVDFY